MVGYPGGYVCLVMCILAFTGSKCLSNHLHKCGDWPGLVSRRAFRVAKISVCCHDGSGCHPGLRGAPCGRGAPCRRFGCSGYFRVGRQSSIRGDSLEPGSQICFQAAVCICCSFQGSGICMAHENKVLQTHFFDGDCHFIWLVTSAGSSHPG